MQFLTLEMNYGKTKVRVNLPQENLMGILQPRSSQIPYPEEAEIERALDNPIGSPLLEQMAKPGMKVVIMASDITRPSPTRKLLPPILARLESAGIRNSDITVVFGMGIHRNHTEKEKRALVGPDIYKKIKCIDSTETERFVNLGTTSKGTPVEVTEPVAECDFLIATGNVEYHYFAGYTGGAKAILPGACSRRAIEANHRMQFLPGAEIAIHDHNPLRQDIEEAGKISGLDFILNVVLDDKKRIIKAVAGNPTKAHAVARQVVDETYGAKIQNPADIVLASAGGYPKDVNMYQAQKALYNASRAVKEGGTIILLAECPEGLGESTFEKYMTQMELDEIIESIREKFVLGGHKAAAIARVLKRADLFLVSSMKPELVNQCKMHPFNSVKEALAEAFEKHGPRASVLLMPYAGSTVPLSAGRKY